jgi:hypothetical protein
LVRTLHSDIPVAWEALAQQPGYVLNWHMAGVGFVTCDSGGFNGPNDSPLLLVRWYQYVPPLSPPPPPRAATAAATAPVRAL